MPRFLLVLTLLLPGITLPASHAGEKPWIEVRSPNFRVLTDGSANDGRRVAREFEQMRAVFAVGFPKMRLELREDLPGAQEKTSTPPAAAKN